MILPPPRSTLFPYTTLFRSHDATIPQVVTSPVTINDPAVVAAGVLGFTLTEGSATLTNVEVAKIGRPHVRTPATLESRIPPSTFKKNDGPSNPRHIRPHDHL